ncbi:Aspartate aminotransferase [subsurface metagenome]
MISEKGKTIPQSPIRKLIPYADEAKARGIHVYHLNIGQPDIKTPDLIFNPIRRFEQEVLSYGPSQGTPMLREAIAQYLSEDYSLNIETGDVFITTGGSEAILFLMLSTLNPGDDILIPEPFYANYNSIACIAGVNIVPITTSVEDGFHLPPKEKIESVVTDKTKAMLVCTPNNPTGTVLTEEEMFIIHNLCKKHSLFLLSDEVYREFVYDGKSQISALSLPEIEERVIVMDSISKRFSACGARVGFIINRNKKIMDRILKFSQARLCPPTLEQIGAIAAYKNIDKYIRPMIQEYEMRRNVLFEGLQTIPGVYGHKPEGAFYTVLKLSVKDADKFCQWLLTDFNYNNKTVMLAPANGFYSSPGKGVSEVRIAYVLKENDLREAIEVLKTALQSYKD